MAVATLSEIMVNAAIAAGACARPMPGSPEKYQLAACTADIRERRCGTLVRAHGPTT
jgi:hypothetical protein